MTRPQSPLARSVILAAALLLAAASVALAQNSKSAAPSPDAPAQNAIEGIDVSTEGGKVTLRLKLKEALANPPANFSLVNPPRIAFDFPNTVNAMGKSAVDINEGDVKSARIGESGGRTRLVLSLGKSVKYTAAVEGQNVVITLQGAAGPVATAPTEATTHFAEAKPAPQPHSVRNIEFKRR